MDRFDALFEKYDMNLDACQIQEDVKKILLDQYDKYNQKAIYSQILSMVDITSLNPTDSVKSITDFVEKINKFDTKFEILPHPAAICIYPKFVQTVKDNLMEDMEIASVAGGFPDANTFIEVKVAEVAMAVMEGATEIDVVIPSGMVISGEYEEIYEDLQEIKAACRDAKLKVILETGVLMDPVLIKKAALVAMNAGADFIKTSTGKVSIGATYEAVYVMAKAAAEYNVLNNAKVGIKVAGGVSTTEQAVSYYAIVASILGDEWLNPNLFRFGASRLVNALISSLSGSEVKYF
ncbi:MAG: deoxyribose-phosphate aldolase [Paludibacteraceae bacterium]|nr:deoxyribose-phosphate aldolase [Paludibacteraceae bacterium]